MSSKSPKLYSWEKPSAFVASLCISFVIIFGIACLVAYNSYKNAIKYTIRSNGARANLLAKIILEHQRAAIGVVRSYGNRPLLIESVKRKDFEEAVKHLANLVKNNPEIEGAFISNPDSTAWVNFPIDKQGLNKDLSFREWYKGVTREWMPYVSSVYKMIVGEKELAVAVCAPIRDEKDKVIGILVATQSTGFFNKIVSEFGLNLDARITLIDQAWHIIYSNRFPYKKEVTDYPSFEFVRKAMRGEKGDVEIRDSSDGDRIKYISFAPVEGIGWSVIVEKAKREVFQSEILYLVQIAVISFLIFMVVVLSLVYFKEKYKQMAVLRESENRLRLLTSQLFTAQENERKRIAHEIHDSLGACLGAIKFKVEDALQKAKTKSQSLVTEEQLETVVKMVQECAEESRRIQMDLRPSILDDLGILPALSWFCRRFQTIYSDIHIEQEISIQEDEVSDSLRTVIYRISQEALNNIAKHSKADLVNLSLRKADGKIHLAIQDNGQGFDVNGVLSAESYRRGLGLGSMRERAELSGGSFAINSARGKGTTIRASWPITFK